MKRCKRIMAFVAFVLAFAMAFTSVSMPVEAAAATSVKSITVKNLPGSSLTLKKGKTFVLKTNVSAGKLKFSTSDSKIVTVTSGGKLKAVKNGKADITVSLKSNSRIKKTIKVTVGQPVTGVKLSKRTLTLRKGKSAVLRATVQTSKASNKKLIWKSSNAKAVKVTQTGKVVAVKPGTVTITATAADGSGKKASCKVTVVNPTKVSSVTVTDPLTVKVVLSQAQKLAVSRFKLKATTVINGAYLVNIPLTSVTTKDNRTYILKFNKRYFLPIDAGVCVYVSGLYGTGTSGTKTYYSAGAKKETVYKTFISEQNVETDKVVQVDSDTYCAFSVSGLPDGIKYKRIPEEYNRIHLVGTPTNTGTTVSTVKVRDELGNVYIVKVTWNVFSDSAISASYEPVYRGLNVANPVATINNRISVSGGYGSYKYAIVGNDYGLSVDSSGTLKGYITKAGTYTAKVKVTDAKNADISVTVNCVIKIVDEIKVSGTLKSKNGEIMPAKTEIIFENRDRTHGECIRYGYADSNGKYVVSLLPGTYDVTIKYNYDITYVFSQTFTKSIEGKNYTSDLIKIAVKSDNSQYTLEGIGKWEDENGIMYGVDDCVYLVPGTYKLAAYTDGSGKYGRITATVTNKTNSITANIESDTVEFGTGTSVWALEGRYYSFVPKETGTYYFYSASSGVDPKGYLYDANKKQLATNDDETSLIKSDNYLDFCVSYSCVAGKTYYIKAEGCNCRIYVTTNDPKVSK